MIMLLLLLYITADPFLCVYFKARYYSVMWCKASSRKHKRWEGDAVLVARGRTVVLKDMEGRDIGRGLPVTAHSSNTS